MELREPIQWINERLIEAFGREFNGEPKFRVVFSDDQFEKRLTSFTDDGFELLHPEVRLLPKYKQHIRGKYILERLVPIVGETDLTEKISYEPCWTFMDKHGNYLPPWFEGCKFIIDAILGQTGQSGHAKYKDPDVNEEERMKKLSAMESELFGNETEVGDHLAYGTGVTVGENTAFEKAKENNHE